MGKQTYPIEKFEITSYNNLEIESINLAEISELVTNMFVHLENGK